MKKRKSGALKYLLIILLLIAIIVGGAFYYLNLELSPVSDESERVRFTVEENSTVKDVLSDLKDENLIRNDNIAYYYIRIKHPVDFKAGDFNLDKSWELEHIFDYISDSSNIIYDTVQVTFIEGEWLKHYADKLAQVTNVSSEELMAYWNDEEAIRALMPDYPFLTEEIFGDDIRNILEGYLFPNTYEFYTETSAEAITRTFLDQTLNIYNEFIDDFKKSELSIHQIFTLASIVQYEGTTLENMKTISSVFYNRINDGMALESSVTICYAINIDKDGDWRDCEYNIDYDSPYNTYKYAGLTPGPILNPGRNALIATLEPDDTNYYYFIADVCGDGKVYFAENFYEHNANVDKYLTCY